ncbi:YggS family pyridoxal phosphate-dependent enzyme [Micavibrio aeruginosavorus]|uniref:YggS family pyridoxal phosphate-dependent enzyme n=1 Tax=Micavibrio aeruginosavorus TaxID=349221 RepID=UPI003F4ADD90
MIDHAAIQTRIESAARACGRACSSVQLVAVSKTQPDEKIDAALRAGLRVFGENRVQEAQARWGKNHGADRRAMYADLVLHLIGPLQTNKVRDAVSVFDVIETVDRPKLVHALAAEMRAQKRALPCFIQVNTGDEAQKAGCSVADLPGLLALCRDQGLHITGLMCIPPVDADPVPHFQLLHDLAGRYGLPNLSMGMSADFETAIAYGATHVRVGSALFGVRG